MLDGWRIRSHHTLRTIYIILLSVVYILDKNKNFTSEYDK